MTCITAFFDLAGRISRATGGYSHVTVAGVAIPTEKHSAVSQQLKSLPKWSEASSEALNEVANHLGRSVVSVAVRIDRACPDWHRFWDEGKRLVREARALRLNVPGERWQIFEPEVQARLGSFVECCGLVVAEVVKRSERPRVLDQHGLGIIQLARVFDSEIQGEDNRELFDLIWRNEHPAWERLLRDDLNVVLHTAPARLSTEMEEPCLLLADYLAGIIHTFRGRIARPPRVSEFDLRTAFAALEKSGRLVESEMRFELSYREIMAKSPLQSLIG